MQADHVNHRNGGNQQEGTYDQQFGHLAGHLNLSNVFDWPGELTNSSQRPSSASWLYQTETPTETPEEKQKRELKELKRISTQNPRTNLNKVGWGAALGAFTAYSVSALYHLFCLTLKFWASKPGSTSITEQLDRWNILSGGSSAF